MALRWDWNEKCGEITFVQQHKNKDGEWEPREYNVSVYEGNCFMIMLYEFKNDAGKDVYNMYSFFAYKYHAKRCLGFNKNGDGEIDNMFEGGLDTFTKIRLNKAKSRNYKDIVTMFAQAFENITIEVYTEKENENDSES